MPAKALPSELAGRQHFDFDGIACAGEWRQRNGSHIMHPLVNANARVQKRVGDVGDNLKHHHQH